MTGSGQTTQAHSAPNFSPGSSTYGMGSASAHAFNLPNFGIVLNPFISLFGQMKIFTNKVNLTHLSVGITVMVEGILKL